MDHDAQFQESQTAFLAIIGNLEQSDLFGAGLEAAKASVISQIPQFDDIVVRCGRLEGERRA